MARVRGRVVRAEFRDEPAIDSGRFAGCEVRAVDDALAILLVVVKVLETRDGNSPYA